jgi:replicative DNA helicase
MTAALWSEDVEAAVLGAALSNTNAARLVVDRCSADDFYLRVHARTFDEIARLVAAGHSPDYLVVAQAVGRDDRPHVQALPGRCPAFTNVDLYVDRLLRLAALRRLALVVERLRSQIDMLAGVGPGACC